MSTAVWSGRVDERVIVLDVALVHTWPDRLARAKDALAAIDVLVMYQGSPACRGRMRSV
jgi:hypothetical protein